MSNIFVYLFILWAVFLFWKVSIGLVYFVYVKLNLAIGRIEESESKEFSPPFIFFVPKEEDSGCKCKKNRILRFHTYPFFGPWS